MWDINTFYYDSTSLMKNLAQSCFSGPCPDHVYLSLVVIGAELKEEIYVWHTSHRRTDTVFTHLIEKPAVLTSVSPRAKNIFIVLDKSSAVGVIQENINLTNPGTSKVFLNQLKIDWGFFLVIFMKGDLTLGKLNHEQELFNINFAKHISMLTCIPRLVPGTTYHMIWWRSMLISLQKYYGFKWKSPK